MKTKGISQPLKLAVAAIFVLWTTTLAFAQVEQGRFVGHIVDPQGAVVTGAGVKVTNQDTNIVQTATTNGSGDFVITPVQTGTYTLTISARGFQTTTSSNIEVQVGQVVREDLALHLGAANIKIGRAHV